jgi:hypothetical protein
VNAPPFLSAPTPAAGGAFAFQLTGAPFASYRIQASTNMLHWDNVATNTLPSGGMSAINIPNSSTAPMRYFRAAKMP